MKSFSTLSILSLLVIDFSALIHSATITSLPTQIYTFTTHLSQSQHQVHSNSNYNSIIDSPSYGLWHKNTSHPSFKFNLTIKDSFTQPFIAPSLILYATSLTQCTSSQGQDYSISSSPLCSTQTLPLTLIQNTCISLAQFPPIPNSTASTQLAYMWDNQWNLNIYTGGCGVESFLANFTNPSWNSAWQCSSKTSAWLQFGWTNDQNPSLNGSMILDSLGQGYDPFSNKGYFLPSQPSSGFCSGSGSITVPSSSPVVTILPIIPPAPFAMQQCPLDSIKSSYSMAVTIGLNNPCYAGCDGTNLRISLAWINNCLSKASTVASRCQCHNTGLTTAAFAAANCVDEYSVHMMRQYYKNAIEACSIAQTPLSIDQIKIDNPSSSNPLSKLFLTVLFVGIGLIVVLGVLILIRRFMSGKRRYNDLRTLQSLTSRGLIIPLYLNENQHRTS